MKRCPKCRRDYYDETLLYCLDDGAALVDGPGSGRVATAVLPASRDEAATLHLEGVSQGAASRSEAAESGKEMRATGWHGRRSSLIRAIAVVGIAVGIGSAIYVLYPRSSLPTLQGSFRSVGSPAYDYYLRGKLYADSVNRDRNENAIKILENVVAIDPTFAPAYAELSRAYGIKANLWKSEGENAKLYDDAKLAAEKSLALDPNLAEGHFARGAVIWTHADRFPHEQAILSLKRAIALDPNLEGAHHQLGVIYYHIGLFDKAREQLQEAIDINPTNADARLRLGLIDLYRTDYERALSAFKTVPREVNPVIVDRSIATVLFELGETQAAAKVVDDFLAGNSDEGGNVTSVRAMILAKEGKEREAEESIRRAVEIGRSYQHFHHTTYSIASAYALLNKHDEALKWLQYTADDGFPCYPFFEKDANLNNLRDDPRFVEMMEKLKSQFEHYQAIL